jgi:hypothetical protein
MRAVREVMLSGNGQIPVRGRRQDHPGENAEVQELTSNKLNSR